MENRIPYQEIKQITNNYDEARLLGRGGFGTVYKGVRENGETIAVKVFDVTRFDDSEFRKEFDNLKRLKHNNIVELLGFCNDTEEVYGEISGKQVTAEKLHMAICLEYVQNGDLEGHISDESTGLHWHTRYKIIKGVCEGLKYLREGINPPILHLDLKLQNILLDKDMTPKVADFGLSRLFGEEKTAKTISTCGTIGYMPPEYTDFQVISEKFDIYSLGVIMVKIIAGRDRFFRICDVSRKDFINQVHDNWKKRLHQNIISSQQVKRCIELALDCMKKNRLERPTIQEIVSYLAETEKMIGNMGLNIEQLQHDGENTLPNIGNTENPLPENDPLPKELSFDFVKRTTNNFSSERILGEHAFGATYKGILEDGQVFAVVQFKPESPAGRTFTQQVHSVSTLRHENILKIYGYCREAGHITKEINGRYISLNMFQAFLCHEHFAGSLHDYIYGDPFPVDWDMNFKIIMGICQGLHFMHEELHRPVIHTDLKPENIFFDNYMVPKILGFGLYEEDASIGERHEVGSIGYMAPEYLYKGQISTRTDIYSLGIIILEITTGERNHRSTDQKHARGYIDKIRKNWTLEHIIDMYMSQGEEEEDLFDQVRTCIRMGLQCVEIDQRKRPSIVEIVDQLGHLSQMRKGVHIMQEEVVKYEQLVEVHPPELCFPFEQKKHISCSLQLRNKGEDDVAFMLVSDTPKRYLTKLPLCGILPHQCTYTHTITMHKQSQHQPTNTGDFFTLHTVAVAKFDLQNLDNDLIAEEYQKFFNKAKDIQKARVTVNCDPPVRQEKNPMHGFSSLGVMCQPTRLTIEIITRANAQEVSSIDVHPTKPWIMTTSKGNLHVWDYKSAKNVSLFEEDIEESVHIAKFEGQEEWIVAGDSNGGIHVYSYAKREDVSFFRAHDSCITSLALHPTRRVLLSSSEDKDNLIKLWDWNKNWQCTRTFPRHAHQAMQVTLKSNGTNTIVSASLDAAAKGLGGKVMQVKFNSNNMGSFTSVSLDGLVKIWSVDNDDGNIVTLDGKDGSLLCVDNFIRHDRQHLIAGCIDGCAQIWNMEIKGEGLVHRLEGHSGRITAVNVHPELQLLITGSFDGTVRLWNSDTYKLDDIINFNLGQVYAFGFIKDPTRIVVGCQRGIAMMEISPS